MDLDLGADVDAAGRLVEDQDASASTRATWRARPSAGCRPTARRRAGRRRSSGRRTARVNSRATASLGRPADEQAREQPRQDRQRDVLGDREVEHQALLVPVLGQVRDPRASSPPTGSRTGPACRRARTTPASRWSIPNSTRATSVRPAPTRPAIPTISPARTENPMSRELADARQAARPRAGRRRSPSRPWGTASPSGPTMWRIRSAVVSSLVGVVMTCRPSRNTVAVSHRSNTSPRRWLTNRIATPRSRRPRTIVNSRSTSCADSDAVGSSRIRTLASTDSALAISISCWSAIDRPRTERPDVEPDVELLEQRLRRAARAAPVDGAAAARDGAWPMNTFSATLRSGNSRGSWWTTAIPSARAWAGPEITVGSPFDDDRPRVGLVDARQDLDQRALARAVLPDERVDAAGAQRRATRRPGPASPRTAC